MNEDVKKNLFPVVLQAAALSAFLLSLVVVIFYAAGTAQEFTDKTQLFLLHLQAVLGLFIAFVSLYGMVYNGYRSLSFFIKKKGREGLRSLAGTGAYMLLGTFGAFLAVFASFISALAGGNA
jgi:hypothetical protein